MERIKKSCRMNKELHGGVGEEEMERFLIQKYAWKDADVAPLRLRSCACFPGMKPTEQNRIYF